MTAEVPPRRCAGNPVTMHDGSPPLCGPPEHVRRLRAAGALDAARARELVARVWTEGAPDTDAVLLDLRAVTSIDAGALAALVHLKDLLGRRLRIEAPGAGRRAAPAPAGARTRPMRMRPRSPART